MALDFSGYTLKTIINPNINCTQIVFSSIDNPDIRTKTLILFDGQIKYIRINEHQNFTRVKIYIVGEEKPIDIDFTQDDSDLFDLFLKSLYNK